MLDFILHLDRYLDALLQGFGAWIYLLVFLVVFAETGLVVTPFLPGDSLLFTLGTMAARGGLDPVALVVLLAAAAILGDTVNYWIGQRVGPRAFQAQNARLFKPEYLRRTERFYERYGAATIIVARFAPIVRTFAPFLAGVGRMRYGRFLLYNVVGGIAWVVVFVLGGYFFGNIPLVKDNLSVVLLIIIAVSVAPVAVEVVRHRRAPRLPMAP
ncbi:MAG: DedA family protein [bacterium]